MTQPLFRPEVMQARRASWLGGISLAQPLRLWILTALAGFAALAIVLFLVFGTYTRRARVVGQLVPVKGMASVLAPATGIVTRMDTPEGGRVEAGETLAVVTVPRATVTGGDTLAALESRLQRRVTGLKDARTAQQRLLDAQAAGLSGQLGAARHELAQVATGIATRREQIRIAEETLGRLRELEDERYVSLLQIKQQESAALAQVGDMQALQRQATATRRLIAQLEQAISELPGQRDAQDAGFARDLALLEQEQVETLARGELAIVAPVSGVVATQMLKPGQAVQAGEVLMTVLPGDGTLEAELFVPSRAIGFIEPGDAVLLRYEAYPYQKFGHQPGQVSRVSRSTMATADGNGGAGGEPHYRINVTLDRQAITAYGKPEPLKPGMLLEADVLGERRTLIEWVLEPLYSIQGTVFDR
ncbi:HlyD family efflux transporter periplasmic adaptor subunit [Lysobacter sp. SG-8]|uniref:HlyD family efflux transporter periplasmic adaptor subunit n=1 Tax=Marilutibacter penaei TaxID=2759900 RepID=A0A7W3U4G5_9GAMM|nr:HlyD family efflux transporter periplasmic adaptor subunit [Lysobacter penaei]MBB1088797.1 HlyD family efflux transporter periplasmic adaptor subunit [Lysobacter penaei]